ncbi:hypothetical protein Dimus_021338 [Dionaea muscipula]
MKLRIRSLESKETLKIEVPDACTLQQLKQSLFARLSLSSSSSTVPENLFLSLNRKDELCGSSPQDSIQSLGVASGDLIYYSVNPYAFSGRIEGTMIAQNENPQISNSRDVQTVELMNSSEEKVDGVFQNGDLKGNQKGEALELTSHIYHTRDSKIVQKDEALEFGDQHGEIQQASDVGGGGKMETSSEGVNGSDLVEVDEEEYALDDGNDKYSVPTFLRRVFGKELADAGNGGKRRLLVISVHAVLLESGFVCFDPVSGMKVEGFHFPDEWPSCAFTFSLLYTLPEILSSEVVETVVLKFQALGQSVNVYGSLLKKGFGIYRVNLDESRFVPALNFVWKNNDHINAKEEIYGSKKTDPEAEVFEFWRILKDGIALPLLIDLCENAGLLPPPCFMRLPTELKLKILELLPGLSVARMACVCTEMHFISSNNDLWKQKYAEEFGSAADSLSRGECQWKARFVSAWENRKKRKRASVLWRMPPLAFLPNYPMTRRDPPLRLPFTIDGDYDSVPGLGRRPHFGNRIRYLSPNCNLGGFNA